MRKAEQLIFVAARQAVVGYDLVQVVLVLRASDSFALYDRAVILS